MFLSTFLSFIALATASFAAPTNGPQELIVFNPPVLSPKASSSWVAGSEQVVRWNTSGIPVQRLTTTGVILLGYKENGSENLDVAHPLATGFPINAGSVKVVLPKNIASRNNYFIVLFGDSGNKSPEFKIHHA